MSSQNILISLEPRHAENILTGRKRLELRRRAMRVEAGVVVWMYAKVPKAQIVGFATVADLHQGSPTSLWRRFGAQVGVSKKEYFEYFGDSSLAFAMELVMTTRLATPVPLSALREVEFGFQPPQFFKRLNGDAQILKAMSEYV